ncbi:GGDEF domain-containing protein [Actinomadura sp. NEAU-AAG7]|nr:GGDEF domain-containing protein [Actinomadura sp. NEAU-AAG7]
MTAVQSSAEDRGGELAHRPRRRTFPGRRSLLMIYVPAVVAVHAGLIIAGLVTTSPEVDDLLTFVALLACGAVCIEATRRLGIPAGVGRDLLSAWWLPVALLLPPLYALLMPIPLQALLQFRVLRTLVHRRVLVASALGIAGACASVVFHLVVKDPLDAAPGWVVDVYPGVPAAVGCAALFTVVNTVLVAVAAHAANPESRWRDVLWTRESLLLDVVDLCVGILVAITSSLTLGLLLLALPPVMLLQRSLMHQQLQAAARTDAKTGLLNAAAWQREAATELARALRTHDPLAVLLIDIDHFKRVNDTHGHLIGDEVLVGVANTLDHQLRDYDLVGRFGGEEFVALLPGTDTVEACRVAERLRGRVRRLAVPTEDGTVVVTVSIGVSLYRTHGEDLIELMAAADLALYRAKASGRDRVCLPALEGPKAPGK